MKLSYWLFIALTGALVGCSSDTGATVGTDRPPSTADDDDDDDDDDAVKDAGRKDAGSATATPTRDSGPKLSMSEDDPDEGKCSSKTVSVQPNSPDILIVLDRSSSMVQGVDRWTPSVNAVQALTGALTETVAFGLMVFPAVGGMVGGFDPNVLLDPNALLDPLTWIDPNTYFQLSCDPGEVNVEVDLNSASDISSFLATAQPDIGATPTSTTLDAALGALNKSCADCASRQKYVLLVTDGAPTCGAGGTVTLPEDVAATVTSVDNLKKADITTYVFGYGIESDPTAVDAMNQFAEHGGTGQYYPVEDEASLVAELTQIAGALVPCEFDLDKKDLESPDFDISYVKVTIDGKQYNMGTDWEFDAANGKVVLHPEGGACPVLRDAKIHKLNISRECEPISFL